MRQFFKSFVILVIVTLVQTGLVRAADPAAVKAAVCHCRLSACAPF
jgi:hypothetical protein